MQGWVQMLPGAGDARARFRVLLAEGGVISPPHPLDSQQNLPEVMNDNLTGPFDDCRDSDEVEVDLSVEPTAHFGAGSTGKGINSATASSRGLRLLRKGERYARCLRQRWVR